MATKKVLAGLLAAAMGMAALPRRSVAIASDACPGAHLKASAGCHVDEVARCACSRREGSSVTVCRWTCEPRP